MCEQQKINVISVFCHFIYLKLTLCSSKITSNFMQISKGYSVLTNLSDLFF